MHYAGLGLCPLETEWHPHYSGLQTEPVQLLAGGGGGDYWKEGLHNVIPILSLAIAIVSDISVVVLTFPFISA